MLLKGKGKKIDDIPVKISYRIIELFSAGLYSSPNKAFEELVSNSYDAYANQVAVYIPSDKLEENAIIWVCDNGQSMDKDGLKDLWKIGDSPKMAIRNKIQNGRLQIGKFGIGKLATYILTNDLTYVCKTKDGYFAVTMNFGEINDTTENLILDEIELSDIEAKEILNQYIEVSGQKMIPFDLFGDDCEDNWTFTILSNLKPKVNDIQEGRLKWILSTALPLNPNFKLHFNGKEINSSKIKIDPWKSWIFGENDSVIDKNDEMETGTYLDQPCVNLPTIKNITGRIDLYRDSLLTGAKSERLGRSHGIFVMVRKRLINIEDSLFGMDALSHGVFNRVRIEIHADELDKYITSTREAIKDVRARVELVTYIKKKFQEVKDWYFNELEEEEIKNRASYKIAHASSSFSRRPLLIAAKKFFNNEISDLWLTDLPKNLSEVEQEIFINTLEDDLTSEKGIIKDVIWETLSPDKPIAKFDLQSGVARINNMHPFFANFIEEVRSFLPFKLIALTEILTEVSMVEQGIDEDQIKELMKRRDAILRELTFSDKPNAPLVASLLMATVSDSNGLEDSLSKAFSSIGFETTPLGGPGKPDGLSYAYLEHRNSDKKYSLTYDAKSTKKEKIMASTAHISGVDRHRDDYETNYAVVVAINFEGAENPDSAVNKEAKKLKVNLIKVSDLTKLIILAGPKQLGLEKLRELFEECHTVIETSKWINALDDMVVEKGPFREILEVAHNLTKKDLAIPNVTSIRLKLGEMNEQYNDISPERIKSLLHTLKIMAPGYVSVQGDNFSISSTPEIILKEINRASGDDTLPLEFRQQYLKAFG
ncbi:MAG TPA: ATP-binding protein [Mariniflexile sp.]